MSKTTINLITFVTAIKDLHRDIRLSRLWGLTQDEARRLRKIPFRKSFWFVNYLTFRSSHYVKRSLGRNRSSIVIHLRALDPIWSIV